MAVGVKRVRVKFDANKLRRKAMAGSIASLGHAGAYIRGIAMKSIKVSKEPSKPGHQPHTRKGRLKRGIFYGVEKAMGSVVIGPARSAVGTIGRTHEFGGSEPPKQWKGRKSNWKIVVGGHGPIRTDGPRGIVVARLYSEGQVQRSMEIASTIPPSLGGPPSKRRRTYAPRPFMGPALEVSRKRLPNYWANIVR